MKYGVIVAEDEILIQQNIIKKIENSGTGFTVVGKAQTGIQALELINASNPYLLVTDIRMPVMDGLELIEFLSLDCTAAEGEWHSDSEIKIDKLGYVILNGQKTKQFWDGTIQSEKQPLRLKIRNICGDETVWEVSLKK